MRPCETEDIHDDGMGGRVCEIVCRDTGVSCRLTCRYGECRWDHPPYGRQDVTIRCKACGTRCKEDSPEGLCSFCQATAEEVEVHEAMRSAEQNKAEAIHESEAM